MSAVGPLRLGDRPLGQAFACLRGALASVWAGSAASFFNYQQHTRCDDGWMRFGAQLRFSALAGDRPVEIAFAGKFGAEQVRRIFCLLRRAEQKIPAGGNLAVDRLQD
jgi:hypothetical protein